MLSEPLVSIYIPTKNRPALLQRAVNSCLAQTYTNIEIIIVDDGSEPENWALIQHLPQIDPRISLHRHAASKGAPASRNTAIFAAKGEYITGLDDDDEFAPNRIALFVNHAHLLANYAALSSGYKVICKSSSYKYATQPRAYKLHQLLFANYIGSQVFTLTSRLQALKGFDTAMLSCQDYDTWIRLAQQYGAIKRLANTSYYLHQEHGFARISDHARVAEGYNAILKKYTGLMNPQHIRSQRLNLAVHTATLSLWPILRLPLQQQWRFFKVMIRQKLNSFKKGIVR